MESKIVGVGFFFVENRSTGEIDMHYNVKYLNGSEKLIVYKSIRYFGLDMDLVLDYDGRPDIYDKSFTCKYKKISCFTLSNEWQDKTIYVALDLYDKKYADFQYVIEFVNDFIQNNLKAKSRTNTPTAFPLLLGYRHGDRHVMFQETDAESRFPERNLIVNVDAVEIDGHDDDETACSHLDTPILNAVPV
jgi:hypothetical protein